MKKTIIIIAVMLLSAAYCFPQGAAINNSGAEADNSSILDISDTTKGILIPRMTKINKLAISSPANGLLIYQTDDTTGFWYYNSLKWVQAIGPAGPAGGGGSCSYTAGQSYGGGIIYYIDESGCHGLISPASDQSSGAAWSDVTGVHAGAFSTDGSVNTGSIMVLPSTTGAAYICDNLNLNGQTDWYLPSTDELAKMYNKRSTIGGFSSANYWSSNEPNSTGSTAAIYQSFNPGADPGKQGNALKTSTYYVRCIRKF